MFRRAGERKQYSQSKKRGEALKIPYWEKPYRNNYLTFEKEFEIYKVQGGQRRMVMLTATAVLSSLLLKIEEIESLDAYMKLSDNAFRKLMRSVFAPATSMSVLMDLEKLKLPEKKVTYVHLVEYIAEFERQLLNAGATIHHRRVKW